MIVKTKDLLKQRSSEHSLNFLCFLHTFTK